MRLLTDVFSGRDGTPDYALIEVGDREAIAEMVEAVREFANRFGGGDPRFMGSVFSVSFWQRDLPLVVTWLHYDAMLDENGDEPEWLTGTMIPPADWEPKLEDDEEGSNVFFGADFVKLEVYPDGTMCLQANLWGGPETMETQEFQLEDFS